MTNGIDGQANAGSLYPEITADGRYITYQSGASNLVPGDTNGSADCFVYDRQAGTTIRVSVSSAGAASTKSNTGPIKFSSSGFWGVAGVQNVHVNIRRLTPHHKEGESDV